MVKGFTLVIPLYNKVNVLRNTLESVLNNHGTYPFKCIIVDDDSTDGSSKIGEEYDEKYPDIFMYIKKKHHGEKTPTYARNLGIKLVETEYVGFLDADDEICPGFIDRGCAFLDEHPEYNLYGCGYQVRKKDEHGDIYYIPHTYNDKHNKIDSFKDYVLNCLVDYTFCSYIYKTKLVQKNMFTNVFTEDIVFKLKYIYNNEPIYLDNLQEKSIIWNSEFSESYTWEKQRNISKNGLELVFDILNSEIPGFKYKIKMINDNEFNFYTLS